MTPAHSESDFQQELLRLRNEVQALALANVHAAELMAELKEARELEEILRANNQQLQRAKQTEEDRSHFLELVARNQPVEALLSCLGDLLAHHDPEQAFTFLLAPQGELKHAYSRGLPDGVTRSLTSAQFYLIQAIRDAMTTKRPSTSVNLAHCNTQEPFCRMIRDCGFQSLHCWPVLNSAGRLLGMVLAYGRKPAHSTAELRERMQQATTLFAMGVEHRTITERLTFQAHHDSLTSLPNRTFFYELLQDALAACKLNGKKVAVLWADLDRFKQINDTLGHRSADLLLQIVAQRLSNAVQSRGTVARMGGDEFVVMMRDVAGVQDARNLAEQLLTAFRDPFAFGDHQFPINLSIGVSIYPDHAEDAEGLVRNADLAMYGAKCLGRNTYVCFTPEKEANTLESFQIEFHLRRALEQKELELFFQPLVSCKDGSIEVLETLLRWYSPALGAVSPAQFIPVAEASGLMHEIGKWVLEEACRHAAEWQAIRPGVRVAVNVSATQLVRGDFCEIVQQALSKAGLRPELLELELTESAIIGIADYQRYTESFRALGVSLAIDDFGTGYSSLSHLHSLKVDTLKMDRSFVNALGKEPASARLAETIIALAKTLGLHVVAEGIETQEQLHWLTDLNCDLLQGYYIHKPMPLSAIHGVLGSRHPIFADVTA